MSTSTSLNTAAPSGSLNGYAAGAGAEPAGAAQAPAATAPHADPLAKLASLFGLHAAATTQRASGAAPAQTYGGPGKTSLRECSESGLSNAPTTKVQPGETSLEQVAERLGFDAQDLARINPRIKDPAALSVGQDIRLPQEAKLSARADVEWPRCPTDTNADPRLEVAEAHRIYKETGEVPQTRNPLAAIEIQEGRLMSRAERYDAMLAKQGKTFAGIDDLERDDRDPGYMTRREFVEEASARHTAAYNACKEDNIRPGTIYNCIQDLAKRDGPQRYRDAREAQERLTWQQWQHAQQQIGAIASSGPLGLIGRGVGHALGGLKGQEAGGAIGGMADAALSFAVGARQIANQRGYNGSAGLELRREAPAHVASAPPSVPGEAPVAGASAGRQAPTNAQPPTAPGASAGAGGLRGGINWNPFRAPSLERYMPNAGNVSVVGATKKGDTAVDFLQLQANHGGRIFAATDIITGSHVDKLANDLLSGPLSKGKNIVIITGRHGTTAGWDVGMKKSEFLREDFVIAPAAKNIEVLDATKLTKAQMQSVLQRGDDVILAWCHSEKSRQVMNALDVNVKAAPF